MIDTFTEKLVFVIEQCARCGIAFALTSDFAEHRRNDKRDFYCPNGHTLVYTGAGGAERLRRQLQEQQRVAEQYLRALQDAEMRAEMEQQQRKAAERELKRTKRRVGNGVCPCCNRSFPNLHDHMRDRHPEYSDAKQVAPATSGRGATIRARRTALGLSQRALAERAGIRQQTYVSLIEREGVDADDSRWDLIERALDELEHGNGR